MSWMVLADTGPLYAAMNPRDQYHPQAQREMHALETEGWEVGVLVNTMLDTYSLILCNLPTQFALQWLEDIENGAVIVHLTGEDLAPAIARVDRYPDQPITLFDSLLASVGGHHGLLIWTLDQHFDILGAPPWYPGM